MVKKQEKVGICDVSLPRTMARAVVSPETETVGEEVGLEGNRRRSVDTLTLKCLWAIHIYKTCKLTRSFPHLFVHSFIFLRHLERLSEERF